MNIFILFMSWVSGSLAVVAALRFMGRKEFIRKRWIFLVKILVSYLVLLLLFEIYEWYLEFKLQSYDLNQDGIFQLTESTVAQRVAFDELINDSGRNLLRLCGLPLLAGLSIIKIFLVSIVKKCALALANGRIRDRS